MKKKWFWPKTCFRSGLNGTQFCLVKSNFNDRRRYFRTISVCVNETIDLLSSFEQEQKKKKLNRIHILNHTSSRAANYLYSAPMKWARQVNDHSRATERTNTEKRTNTHFPNKEIDFYNWRQLRHTAEFIFQFMFWMRNCFARTYHIHCDWINDGIGVREWRFCSRTSLIIIISDSKMFFFCCLLLYLPTGFRYVCDSSQRTVAVHCVVGWCVPFFCRSSCQLIELTKRLSKWNVFERIFPVALLQVWSSRSPISIKNQWMWWLFCLLFYWCASLGSDTSLPRNTFMHTHTRYGIIRCAALKSRQTAIE